MPDVDKISEMRGARKKVLQDQVDFATSRISETVRLVALGQIGVTYTIMNFNTPFAKAMLTAYPKSVFWIFVFGCGALLLDALHYIFISERGNYFLRHLDRDFATGWLHKLVWISYRLKAVVAVAGLIVLGSLLVEATSFASKTTTCKPVLFTAQQVSYR
jgi:hypothetical protein